MALGWLLFEGRAGLSPPRYTTDFYDLQGRAILQGRLDIRPPEALGIEAFEIDGRSYVYFGIAPSLLRLPVLALTDRFDGARDCMYIVELRGVPAGCIAIAHTGNGSAQLRFFFLEKAARGLGLGGRLMDLAIAFCKEKNYRHVFLWTCSKLDAARYLYGKYGFRIAETKENSDWGGPMVEELWELDMP